MISTRRTRALEKIAGIEKRAKPRIRHASRGASWTDWLNPAYISGSAANMMADLSTANKNAMPMLPLDPTGRGTPVGPEFVTEGAKAISNAMKPSFTLDDTRRENPGEVDPYWFNILVGGANAGGDNFFTGASELPFSVLANGKNHALFRNGDIKGIREKIKWAIDNGLHPRVWGHSWGGSDVANLSKDYPDIPFYAIDPVSWFGQIKEVPKNLTILRPYRDETYKDELVYDALPSVLATRLGHRWKYIPNGEGKTIEYKGGHVGGVDRAVRDLHYKLWRERLAAEAAAAKSNAGVGAKGTVAKNTGGSLGPELLAGGLLASNVARK